MTEKTGVNATNSAISFFENKLFKEKILLSNISRTYKFLTKNIHYSLDGEENIECKWFNYAITL